MRHTFLVATLSSVAASVLTTAIISGSLFGPGTASSANTPAEAEGAVLPAGLDSVLQGDINCDGVVDAKDALGDLRYVGGLGVQQDEPCPDVGTLAAIPGPPGPPGPQGEQGEQGPAGQAGISDPETVIQRSSTTASPFTRTAIAPCPSGKQPISGGGVTSRGDVFLNASLPWDDPTGWYVAATQADFNGQDWYVEAWAICANVAE